MLPGLFLAAAMAMQPDALEQIVWLAHAVPPEFGADALLRLAESGRGDREARSAWIEQAFQMAAQATFPVKMSFGVTNSFSDTRAGSLTDAYALELDALSLRCRAIRAMLPLDKMRGRRLFQDMPPLEVPRYSCKDVLTARVNGYYKTVQALAQEAFTAEEMEKSEPIRLVEAVVRGVRSPRQLEPAARLILDLKPGRGDLATLLAAFASAMEQVNQDDRAFGTPLDFNQRVWDLAALCREVGVSPDPLVRAYRKLLAAHFGGPRCADHAAWGLDTNQKGAQMDPLARVWNLGGLRKPPNVAEELTPLSDEEYQPTKVLDPPEPYLYWKKPASSRLFETLIRLRREREAVDFPTRLRDFLSDIEAWKPEDEPTSRDYFHQRAALYADLARMELASEQREAVISRWVAFLSASRLQQESPVEWFTKARGVLRGPAGPGAPGSMILTLYEKLAALTGPPR